MTREPRRPQRGDPTAGVRRGQEGSAGLLADTVARLRGVAARVEAGHRRSRSRVGPASRPPAGSTTTSATLEPLAAGGLSQPDQTTCGSSALVMSRMLHRPAYARWMRTGQDLAGDAGTDTTDPRTPEQRFADESLAMHRRTNGLRGRGGRLQLPWPLALGTQPWALAAEMSDEDGSGAPGRAYEVRTVAPSDRGATYDAIAAAVGSGSAVPLFVGSTTRPGHVVLVIGSEGGSLGLYDPATGQEQTVTRDDLARGRLRISGWDEPWFAVLPS